MGVAGITSAIWFSETTLKFKQSRLRKREEERREEERMAPILYKESERRKK